MPEPSERQRAERARLAPQWAALRPVDCLERGYDIEWRCQYCGTSRTWDRQAMLSTRLRACLAARLEQIAPHVVCPRKGCKARGPITRVMQGGYSDACPPEHPRRRDWLVGLLLDHAIAPETLGVSASPPRRA